MAKLPTHNVRWQSLQEIAEQWAPEARKPVSFMLRELQYAVVNIPRLKEGKPRIEVPIPEADLANPTELVDREWLIEFCGKQGWTMPSFWDGPLERMANFPGRPGYPYRVAITQELHRRAHEGELCDSLAVQSRELHDWCRKKFPLAKPPTARTIENALRQDFRQLKLAPQK